MEQDRPDVVVVGGGVVGICVALSLQRTGRKVRVIERREPGAGASGRNAGAFSVGECVPTGTPGVLRSVPRMLRDPLSPLAIRWSYLPRIAPWLGRFVLASRSRRVEEISVALHSLMERALVAYEPLWAGTDAEGLVSRGGMLQTHLDDRSFESIQPMLDLRTRRGTSYRVLDNAGMGQLDPVLWGRFRHGVLFDRAAHTTDPRRLTAALAARFTADGGELRRADVEGFELARGRVQAVATSDGRVAVDAVVICAGAWSRRLVRRLGFDVPLDTERGYGVDLPDPGLRIKQPLVSGDHHFTMTPLGAGLRLAGTAELAGLTAPPNFARADILVRLARAVFPEIRTDGARPWISFRPSMPDSLPVIGRSPRQDNAYLAFGHGHKGLGQGAITGRLIQEMVEGKSPTVDVEPFRPERFRMFPRPWARSATNH